MSKSRYFMSRNLEKLEDAYVCFRYWATLKGFPNENNFGSGVPIRTLSIVKNKIKRDVFAQTQANDYNYVFNLKTGRFVQKGTAGFKDTALEKSAEMLSYSWVKQKLGENGLDKIGLFIQRFARTHHILAVPTTKPLITMALSKDDWTAVRNNIINTKIHGNAVAEYVKLDCNKDYPEDGPVPALNAKFVGTGEEVTHGDYSIKDAEKSANCIDLVEVDKNGEPLAQ